MIDKDEIKNSLDIDQIFELLNSLGGEPNLRDDYIISRTICHNPAGEGSHKLYYYDNTKLFKCFTDCGETFDVFELIQKIYNYTLGQAIYYISNYFGIILNEETNELEQIEQLEDWNIFEKNDKFTQKREKHIVDLKVYDDSVLKFFPHIRIPMWEKEGIKQEIIKKYNIAYNPLKHEILIPHYNIDNQLIGIRSRTLVKEEEEGGKYKPSIINKVMYNHPLGFNLYNLNQVKENIQKVKKAIIAESEKSCLQFASYFGNESNICVACCGSSISDYQIKLLLSLGVQEIIIGFDKQFQEIGDNEWKKLVKNFYNIHNKYNKYTQISYLFDKEDLLNYKDSPFDRGAAVFNKLFKERVIL